eukprot:403367965
MSQSRRQTQEVAGNTRSKSKSKTRTETQQQPKSKSKTRAKLIDSDEEEKSHIVARPNYDSKHRQIPSTSMTASKRKQHQRDEQEDDKEEAKAHQASSKHKPNQSKKSSHKTRLTYPGSDLPKKIKLYYFDIYGRAEPIRMLLIHAGIEFEDIQYNYLEFPQLKEDAGGHDPRFEFDQLPVIELDGEYFAQSLAILRMMGKFYGYFPSNDPRYACRIDEIVDLNYDVQDKFWQAEVTLDPEQKASKMKEYLDKTVPHYFNCLETRLIKHNHQYLCGEEITTADIMTIAWAHSFMYNKQAIDPAGHLKILEDFPDLEKYFDKMTKQVQKRLDSRKETMY